MHKIKDGTVQIPGLLGYCGSQEVFLGFADAGLLHTLSFADVVDDVLSQGYQRRFNQKHSLDFKRYIQESGSSTIPLTFNLRPALDSEWTISRQNSGSAVLKITSTEKPIMAQVDCQHRLGSLAGMKVGLAFMSFIGLSVKDEMRIFTIINGKAKGLNTSLLDHNWSRLCHDLAKEEPHLYIALHLNNDQTSPWYQQLDLGGKNTSGMKRRASLRTMQIAISKFLRGSNILELCTVDEAAAIILNYWKAVTLVLEKEWQNPRKHFITKGIGVYGLMLIAIDLYLDATAQGLTPSVGYFTETLSVFLIRLDWSNRGPLEGFNGESGALRVYRMLQEVRARELTKSIS